MPYKLEVKYYTRLHHIFSLLAFIPYKGYGLQKVQKSGEWRISLT